MDRVLPSAVSLLSVDLFTGQHVSIIDRNVRVPLQRKGEIGCRIWVTFRPHDDFYDRITRDSIWSHLEGRRPQSLTVVWEVSNGPFLDPSRFQRDVTPGQRVGEFWPELTRPAVRVLVT